MAKIYIETFGCSANTNNSEIIAGLLQKKGHTISENEEHAEIIVLNTCTVKKPTESKIKKRLAGLHKKRKKIITAGCMAEVQADEIKKSAPEAAILGLKSLGSICKAVDSLTKNKIFEELSKAHEQKLLFPEKRKNPVIGILQVSEGCLGKCSYCIVRLAKGKLFSYTESEIIEKAKSMIKQGCKEIWFTSQDTAAYGLDSGRGIISLLKKLNSLEGSFMIRIGMMNPQHLIPVADEMAETINKGKIFHFLHIPLQSGSSRILKKMNRPYTAEDFLKLAEKMRKKISNLTISTDIICGFPGETEKDFMDTVDLIKKSRPDVLNISRFWPRPGTEAEKMPGQIHGNTTKQRSQALTKEFRKIALEKNKKWISWKGQALVDEKQKNCYIARNISYKPIVIKSAKTLLSKKITIEITGATECTLRGKITKQNPF